MKQDQSPGARPQGSCPPPQPPGRPGTAADFGEPHDPTPQELVYRKARGFGLTETEAREVVRETGLRVAACIVNGKVIPSAVDLKACLLRLADWCCVDKHRGKRRVTNRFEEQYEFAA